MFYTVWQCAGPTADPRAACGPPQYFQFFFQPPQQLATDSRMILFTQIKLRVVCNQQQLSRSITCQRCLSSTVTYDKMPRYRNLTQTFEDSLPCYCYAAKTNGRTIRSQVSQAASAGIWVNCKLITGWHHNSELGSFAMWMPYRKINCYC